MRVWVWMTLVGVLGIAVGIGATALDLLPSKNAFVPYGRGGIPVKFQPPKEMESPPPAPGALADGAPKAQVLGDRDFNFGSMERLSTRTHTFKIKNIGTAPLKLIKGNTTCKCTLSSLSGSTFAPGDVAEVTLEWTSKTLGEEEDFSQTAEIHTNDPENPILRLKIHGVIAESIRVLPDKLVVNRVSSNVGTTTHFRIYGFRTHQIEMTRLTYEEERLKPYFDLQLKPMTEAEYKEEKGAISGALATLHIKPGLPIGPLLQKLHMTVKTGPQKEATLDIPVEGSVTGDIVVTGAPKVYLAEKNLVNFGMLKEGRGAKTVLYVFVKGPHRHDVKFGVGAMDPPNYFKVHFSAPQELNQGKTIKYLVTVQVLPHGKPIDRLGYDLLKMARITLTTTHPDSREIPIYVRFGIE